jgi:hypothetical protein
LCFFKGREGDGEVEELFYVSNIAKSTRRGKVLVFVQEKLEMKNFHQGAAHFELFLVFSFWNDI